MLLKRLFDISVTIPGILLLSPVYIVVAALIVLKLGRPVFFTQERPGLHGKPFNMIKFRTMTNETDDEGNLLPNEERMTKFGSFLRSYSLDELPELFNVLKGDMSLVGPRPLLIDYLPYFSKEQHRRHEVKPGITGWSQVNGRNAIGWDKKLELDVWYVDNRSFWLDLKILWLTVVKVIKREGITHEGHVGMPRFDEYVKIKRSGS
ncbi:sugar transferase [Balneolaceae bacterium YR4-1]|uniref:Sugar transferase n=1 Tax=Halalkalibaculum roseum TaxID=2709311 RepID=A0A6M1SV26_9BACT|nr:sugar transferase [Halalkalibaculum roseum]